MNQADYEEYFDGGPEPEGSTYDPAKVQEAARVLSEEILKHVHFRDGQPVSASAGMEFLFSIGVQARDLLRYLEKGEDENGPGEK